ncbi:hypothetical protein [Oceanobacillus sp. CFH 90083]|nr:hypothetical protein [Oceanobacillus sp. CFH 90083]
MPIVRFVVLCAGVANFRNLDEVLIETYIMLVETHDAYFLLWI